MSGLACRDDLLECYLQCQQLEAKMRSRQGRGANTSGRFKKHDTARNNCLQRVVYPGLCMGKLPTADDAKRASGKRVASRQVRGMHACIEGGSE